MILRRIPKSSWAGGAGTARPRGDGPSGLLAGEEFGDGLGLFTIGCLWSGGVPEP